MNRLSLFGKALILLVATPALAAAQSALPLENTVRDVQQYGFAIHILAMLLVGFGFLMVFAKRYGYGALTGTYLVVAAGIPVYVGLRSSGVLSAEAVDPHTIRALLLARGMEVQDSPTGPKVRFAHGQRR